MYFKHGYKQTKNWFVGWDFGLMFSKFLIGYDVCCSPISFDIDIHIGFFQVGLLIYSKKQKGKNNAKNRNSK